MNREEEIQREADRRWWHESANNQRFVEACKWADQHPREGLWDSEKVIKWLRNNAGIYLEDNRKYGEGCEYDTSELIKDLCKAMEE